MRLWLLIILALFVQEIASTNVVLLSAAAAHYNQFIIHAIFLAASSVDLWFGYTLGKYVRHRFKGSRVVRYAERAAAALERHIGNWGERVVLLLLGTVSYIYVNALLVAWLPEKRRREAFALIFAGNLIWYTLEWLLVLGVRSVSSDFTVDLAALLALSVIVIVALRFVRIFTRSGGDRE